MPAVGGQKEHRFVSVRLDRFWTASGWLWSLEARSDEAKGGARALGPRELPFGRLHRRKREVGLRGQKGAVEGEYIIILMSYLTSSHLTESPEIATEANAAHACVLSLGRNYQDVLAKLAVELLRIHKHRWHLRHGCKTIAEYAEKTCGLRPRLTRELVRSAQILEELPVLATAFAEGDLAWSKVREVTRVATAETEQEWLEYGQEHSCRQVDAAVAAAVRGDRPPAPGTPLGETKRVRLTFEVEAVTAERLRAALTAIGVVLDSEREGHERANDDARLDAMARMVCERLASEEAAPSAEAFQVVVAECPICKEMTHLLRALLRPVLRNGLAAPAAHGHGEEQVVAPERQAQIRCDSVVIETDGTRQRSVPARTRRQVVARQRGICAVPGCESRLWLDVHHLLPFAQGGSHQPANLCATCPSHHAAIHAGGLGIDRGSDGELRFQWRLLPEPAP